MISKISYRDQVRNILLNRMKSGELTTGQSISLAKLSRELNISVTPIREALTQLEQSRILKAIPNRGFIIPEIKSSEAKNLYELVACLEVLAVENSIFSSELISLLKKQQEKFKKTNNAVDRINADMIFHELLTSQYNNPLSSHLLSDLKIRIFFFEKKFMKENGFYKDSNHHHDKIIQCLEDGDLKEATKVLKENWMQINTYSHS